MHETATGHIPDALSPPQASGCVTASQLHEVGFLLALAQRKVKPEFLKYTKQLPNRYRPHPVMAQVAALEYKKADV
jgi:hypothetical protein